MVTQAAYESALRAFETRSEATVLDLVEDSDLEAAPAARGPRRLRFRRADLLADVLVHEAEDDRVKVLVRLTPRDAFLVRASTRGRGLTVEGAVTGRSDDTGVARLLGLPHGVTSLLLERDEHPPARTAWVRL